MGPGSRPGRRDGFRFNCQTADASPHSRGRICPSDAWGLPSKKQRAQGMPGARRTHSLACEMEKTHELVTTGSPKVLSIPCAMVLTVSFVLSPVTGLFCHRRHADRGVSGPLGPTSPPRNLTPASGRQDHTTSPSASAALVSAPPKRPPHPAPNVRDDRDTPLLRDGMPGMLPVIWGWDQGRRMRQIGTTGKGGDGGPFQRFPKPPSGACSARPPRPRNNRRQGAYS